MNKEFDKINICFAIDDKYTEHCSVAIVSILKNSSSLFHFFILNSGLNIENKQKIERLKNIKSFNITFIEVKLNHFENCYLPPGSHFSLVNYYRLKIASLLPHLDKVIYLDSDIIANRDLRELWEISLEGYYVGACKAMTYESNSERLGLSTGAPYINSGVLVLNLKKFRKNRIEDKFFDCIKKNPKVIRNVDQDIINLVLLEASDGIKQLRQNWNTEIRTDIPFEKVYLPIISEPYIIHFITGDKPWNPDSKQLYKEKYWEYHKEILMAERWSRESFIIKEYFNDDRTVRQGPFRGMNYSVGKSICSALLPKIYGSYEEPIQKWIQEIINNKYENIINIGCAEGYYAIGLALTSPNSKVYAYDTDAEALLLCKELARSNNVESKIIINDLCTHKELEYFGSKKTIVICDIEGDELHLLDPSLAEGLQYTDIIIEAHDFIADGISETLSDRFKHTHKIEMIVDYEREPKMVLGENINEEILREIIDEKRPVGMKWLRMISLKKYQKQSICSNNYAQESNKYVTQMINKCVKNKNNNKKGVVYTCITGGYDALVKHTFVDHNWDYVCFTDDLSIGNIDNYSWQIRPLRFDKLDNTRNQRWHKIHPHILFPEYEKSIWLDANINILNEDVFADIDKAIDESCLISIAPHPERNCIYDELIVCAALGKDDEGVMRKQVDLIRSAGFPEKNGLFETNIMYRDHHNYQVIEIMNDWWWWIENFSRRDQLSLSYVLWQHKLKVKPLADISYRYSGGIEFINNTSHVTKEELIVQRDQLQQVLNLRDSKIVDFNQKMQTLTEQLEKRDSVVAERDAQIANLIAERAHILSSTSWKITRPMRYVGSLIRKVGYLLSVAIISLKSEPFLPLMKKSLKILREEGLGGVKVRIRRRHFLLQQTQGIDSIDHNERTSPFSPLPIIEAARPLEIDYSASVPFEFIGGSILPKRGKVAAVIHLYYEELACEFLAYLVNIPFDIDVYISTTDSSKASAIECVFSNWNKGRCEIRVVPNRGRDIGPKIAEFVDVYERYEYILFLHGKKSNHAHVLFYWRHFLLESLVGTPDVIKSILYVFEQFPNIGIVAAQHFEPMRHWVDWGGNFPRAKILAEKMGFNLNEHDPLDFPAGSMFWARSEALKPLIDLGLRSEDFEAESNQIDATLANAIERIYFHVCEHAGFDWIKIARPELYDQTPNIVEIKTGGNLSAFLNNHLFRLLDPNGVKPRAVMPHPVANPSPRLLNCLRRRFLGMDIKIDPDTRVAVGLVTYNNTGSELINAIESAKNSLRSVGLRTSGALFLIDNGESTENEIQQSEFITRLKTCGNLGFGGGHNKLMDAAFTAGFEIYVTLNPDGILHPDSVEALVQTIQAASGKALVEALQFPVEHPKPYDMHTLDTPWVSGACLAISREAYEDLGGFDANFFMFCEDVDLSWRARAHGYALKICPRALFLHAVTNREMSPEILQMYFESGIILARKWGSREFEAWLKSELALLGKTMPACFPEAVPFEWRRFSDFSHHFTFAKPRW